MGQVRDTKFGKKCKKQNFKNVTECCKNVRVTAFTVSESLRENQKGGGVE